MLGLECWRYAGVSRVISTQLQAPRSAVKPQGGVLISCTVVKPERRHRVKNGEKKGKSMEEISVRLIRAISVQVSAGKTSCVCPWGHCASCCKANIESASACSVLITCVHPGAWKRSKVKRSATKTLVLYILLEMLSALK